MYSSRRCKNLTYLCGTTKTPSHVSQYRAENRNLRKSGSTFCHGTVFTPKQCLHQKAATHMESPKMCSSGRCNNLTYLCGTANDPITCKSVQSREEKFAEIWVYLLPWYSVCTKAMFMSKRSCGYAESKNVLLSSVQKPHFCVRDCKRPYVK